MTWNRRGNIYDLWHGNAHLSCHPWQGQKNRWQWSILTTNTPGVCRQGTAPNLEAAQAAALAVLPTVREWRPGVSQPAWDGETSKGWQRVGWKGTIHELVTDNAVLDCFLDEDREWRWYMLPLTADADGRQGVAPNLEAAKAAAIAAMKAWLAEVSAAVGAV